MSYVSLGDPTDRNAIEELFDHCVMQTGGGDVVGLPADNTPALFAVKADGADSGVAPEQAGRLDFLAFGFEEGEDALAEAVAAVLFVGGHASEAEGGSATQPQNVLRNALEHHGGAAGDLALHDGDGVAGRGGVVAGEDGFGAGETDAEDAVAEVDDLVGAGEADLGLKLGRLIQVGEHLLHGRTEVAAHAFTDGGDPADAVLEEGAGFVAVA